ncbi:MAG: T9SS type A sorting domain-containing protein [Ignavibacteria bacterium]|nr:T9SS type A sorting domain-containing protein [Ignavibacteria bacterium]
MKNIIITLYFIFPAILLSQWDTQITGTTENLRTIYFVNPVTGYAAGENGKMLRTANGGNIWSSVNTGITQNINSIYFFNASSGIACADDGIIIATTNSGANWSTIPSGVTDNLYSISFANSRGVCAGSGGTLLYSTNSGLNWTISENGFISTYYGADMFSESFSFAVGVNTIFQPLTAKSTNGGANWTFGVFYLNGNEGNLSDVSFISESAGFATSRVFDGQGGISRTTNSGADWTTQLFPQQLHSVDFVTSNIGYCVGENGLILKTTTEGFGWDNQPGSSVTLRSVHFTDSINGYAAGDMGKIIKTTNGGLSAIGDPVGITPDTFLLYQNYPNPFNPVTVIRYSIPSKVRGQTSDVKLVIYDNLGKEVATLVNEKQNAGDYLVTFDGSNLSGGIYYYKINAGDFSEVRKMLLLK